jgi:hypothetical protein
MKPAGAGGAGRGCPDTLHPVFGRSLMRTFFVSCVLFQVEELANWACVSCGKPKIRAGIVDVFQMPVPVSSDVLIIVKTRKTRLSTNKRRGNVSHSHLTEMYVSL